ncbi:MAG: hypothetical protein IPO07_29570 [Haliscomenobacter sp.]|nr:hypothetical protein [Haliscomenobacter sp.]MBK9492479.1 hypothetical protein [Haliscomenobacter sp.]
MPFALHLFQLVPNIEAKTCGFAATQGAIGTQEGIDGALFHFAIYFFPRILGETSG